MTSLKSYILRGTQWYYVDTDMCKTQAWEYDYAKKERGSLLFMGESFGASLHLRVVKNLSEHGRADCV